MKRRGAVSLVVPIGFLALFLVGRTANEQAPSTQSEPGVKHASGAISLTSDGATLLVVNPDSNSITLVDTKALSVLAEIPVGIEPVGVAMSSDDGLAYVSNKGSDTLSAVDLATQSVVAEIPLEDRPVGVAVAPDGRFLAVAELGADQVRFLDTADLRTLFRVPVADRPYGLSFTPDGQHLLISHLLSGYVTVLPVRPYATYLPLLSRRAQGIHKFWTESKVMARQAFSTPWIYATLVSTSVSIPGPRSGRRRQWSSTTRAPGPTCPRQWPTDWVATPSSTPPFSLKSPCSTWQPGPTSHRSTSRCQKAIGR